MWSWSPSPSQCTWLIEKNFANTTSESVSFTWFHGYNLHNCAISVSWRKNTDAFFGHCTTCIESLNDCELLHIKVRSYCLQAVQGIDIKGQKTSLGMAFIRKWHNDSITTDITQSLAVAIGMKKRPLNTQTICCPPWTNLRQCSCTILKYVTLSNVSQTKPTPKSTLKSVANKSLCWYCSDPWSSNRLGSTI